MYCHKSQLWHGRENKCFEYCGNSNVKILNNIILAVSQNLCQKLIYQELLRDFPSKNQDASESFFLPRSCEFEASEENEYRIDMWTQRNKIFFSTKSSLFYLATFLMIKSYIGLLINMWFCSYTCIWCHSLDDDKISFHIKQYMI